MKKITLLVFVLFNINLFAQVITPEEISRFHSDMKGGFGRYDDQIAVTKKLVTMASRIAKANNVDHKIVTLTNERNKDRFQALEIIPSYSSIANREVMRVDREYGGLKLIFSPYELKRSGANAFYVPSGERIGVPRHFIFNELTESYYHEMGHATTYQKLVLGLDDTYAGVLKISKGTQMSKANSGGYSRFTSVDELKMTLYSASLSTKELYELYKKFDNRRDFNRVREHEEKLGEILFSLENGYYLAKQLEEVTKRSIEHLKKNEFELKTIDYKVGSRLSRNIQAWEIKSFSYEKERALVYTEIEHGSSFVFYSLNSNKTSLIKRLEKISKESSVLAEEANRLKKLIGLRIMYADIASTDIERLAKELVDRFSM